MHEDIKREAEKGMKKAITSLQHELAGIRTGRASVALLDGIKVDYYGSMVPVKQVANISVPESRLIAIQPYQPDMFPVIEKAILASGLGLTPQNDGHMIRLPIPQLTEERRKELVKLTRKHGEECKIRARVVRREAIEKLKKGEKEASIPEDERHRGEKEIQELTDKTTREIDDILKVKGEEIMEV